jgi:NTE family protein
MPTPEPAASRGPSVGLVLSAGGGVARAYHAGTLAALAEATGWDPRTADLIVGTSAGSTAAAYLRAGLSASDDHARFVGGALSAEGGELMARVRHDADHITEGYAGDRSSRPLRASLLLRAATGRVAIPTALAGIAPAGTASNTELGDRIRDVCGMEWPHEPTWVCAVRVRDGRRVVFGRDDVFTPDIGTAAQASCAIPRVVQPIRIGDDDYMDGATHSSTNADLVAPLAFDAVVIVSSMSAPDEHVSYSLRHAGRAWFSRVMRREVALIRSHDTPVLVIQPTGADLAVRTRTDATQADVARQAHRSVAAQLTSADNAPALEVLQRARDAAASQPHR